MLTPVNVSQVKALSPFRYPGGKTWLVPHAMEWLAESPVTRLVEPFAGGAMVGLASIATGSVDSLELWELDEGVASVWEVIFHGDAQRLVDRILDYSMTLASVAATLDESPHRLDDLAFQTIVRNRAQRGGIMAPGAGVMKSGDGRGVASRWYPETLGKRIVALQEYRGAVEARRGDGLGAVRHHANNPGVGYFVDPPYTAGGKRAGARLYRHNVIDHERLFETVAGAAGPALMTYDDCPEVHALVNTHGMTSGRIPMKTGHHVLASELVINHQGVTQ